MGSRDRDRSRSRQGSSYRGRRRTRSRSRSRSRHSRRRSRSRRSHRDRSRSRSRSRSHRRGRSRSSSSSSSSSDVVEVEPPIRSNDLKYVNARVFIGRLPPGYTKEELSDYFKRYGPMIDTIVHAKGYGFVQFTTEENARTAVDNERGSIIKGHNVDVKMASEGRRAGRGGGGGIGRGGDNGRRLGGPPPAPPGGRERSPVFNDRFRDPYRDQQPPPRDDPYFRDPYRRPPPPDQYDRFDDPYRRREPFDDPYARDPYYAPPPPPRRAAPPVPMECEILMLNPQLRNYADVILNKLKALKIVAGILSFPEDQNVQKQLEEMAKQGVLYAIVINMQNEVHSSVILNILHGTPQEHRNMPLDDAINLVSKNLEEYLREKGNRPPPAAPLSRGPPPASSLPTFGSPTPDISYLLNLLADNRQLTVGEIEKIILYLRDRRDKMLEAEGRRPMTEDSMYHSEQASKQMQSPPQQDQEELKNKILSILNGSNAKSASHDQTSSLGYRHPEPTPAQSTTRSIANPAMINFDNPSVQQALDNLIQTGPNLLKTINTTVGLVQSSGNNNNGRLTTAPPTSPGYGGQAALSPTARPSGQQPGYSQRPGPPHSSPPEASGYGGHQGGLMAGGRQQQQMYGASGGRGAPLPPGMRRY